MILYSWKLYFDSVILKKIRILNLISKNETVKWKINTKDIQYIKFNLIRNGL
jgi:hypothetical protein